ncbi:MAG: glycosyltransferase family 39 protein [Candidatus Gastranaerophilales bacterium]|nr:glycosyltransferase family 39 protein [Candidatus Gastranaerophilales bacterium]
MEFIKKHSVLSAVLILLLACFFVLFYGLGSYPFIDVDETRYAIMAREILLSHDWVTMQFNFEPFFDKPPLYFWLVAISYKIFGVMSSFAARLPVALLAAVSVFATYYFVKRVKSNISGLVSALILLTMLEFTVLARISIIDMVFAAILTLSVYSGALTNFCEEKNEKFYWYVSYALMGLAILAKGLVGFVLPFGILFVFAVFTKRLKNFFNPVNIIPSFIIMLLVSMPWYVAMYQKHGMIFIEEHIIRHHFGRFIDSGGLKEKEPVWYFIPVLLIGIFPYVFNFLALIIKQTKNAVLLGGEVFGKIQDWFVELDNSKKLNIFALVYAVCVFGFFSISSGKLPTYILPMFPAVAILLGNFWCDYLIKDENKYLIKFSSMFLAFTLFIGGMFALASSYLLPQDVADLVAPMKIIVAVWFLLTSFLLLAFIGMKKKYLVFAMHVLFMAGVSIIAVHYVFDLIHKGGQNELAEYSSVANEQKAAELVTYNFGIRPSAYLHFPAGMVFITEPDKLRLQKILSDKNNVFVIIKNSNEDNNIEAFSLTQVKQGNKYSLYRN